MRREKTRRTGWRWLALAVGALSALSLAEASMARWPAGWQVSDLPAAQPGQAGAGQRQRAVKLQADGSQALVMEVTRMPLQSGQEVNLEKVLGHMRKLVQIEFLRNGLQTACRLARVFLHRWAGGAGNHLHRSPARRRGDEADPARRGRQELGLLAVLCRPGRRLRCKPGGNPRGTGKPALRVSAIGRGRGRECRRITPAALFALRRVASAQGG